MSIPVNATLPTTASDEAAGVEEATGVEVPAGVEVLPAGVEVLPVGVEVPASEVPGTDSSVCEVAGASVLAGGVCEFPGPPQDANKSAAERIKTCERLFFIKILLFELPKESQSSGL